MSSSDDVSGSSGSGSSGSEDEEQLVPQVVTGANADPQVLQYFWDLASLQQVSPWVIKTASGSPHTSR